MARIEVTHRSWLSRLLGSFAGVIVGVLLFVGSFVLLFWNEGRAVRTARSLEEGAGAVISVTDYHVDPANQSKLVHVTGLTATSETLRDPDFGVSAPDIKLRRVAEMYQWRETKKSETTNKLGGGTETVTTYNYEKAWDSDIISSQSFKENAGHENPAEMPARSASWSSSRVTVGAFELSPAQVAQLEDYVKLPIDETALANLDSNVREMITIRDGGLYFGDGSTGAPKIGDVRVAYSVVKTGPVSLVAKQIGNSFEPYHAAAGGEVLLMQAGTVSAEAMFQAAQTENTIITWVVRVGGFIMMFVGLVTMLRPIRVFGDVIPILGSVLGFGSGLAAAGLAFTLSLVTIAVSWMVFRPVIGITLLVIAIAGLLWTVARVKKRKTPPHVVPPPIPAT